MLARTDFLPLLFKTALGERPYFEIYGDDYPTRDGTCVRDYVHVADIAGAHLRALNSGGAGFSAYNIGTGTSHSVREVIEAVERVTGKSPEVRLRPRRAGDPAVLCASPAKLERELGWRPRASELDVYAIGRYRGSKRSRFELAQLGTSRLVIAHDEGCADVKVDVECDSTLSFYLVVGGHLFAAADSPAQRLRYGNVKGVGRVQYRLMTDAPVIDGHTIKIHEKLQVRDSAEEDVRKAEGDRVFALDSDNQLKAQQDSLWAQIPRGP